MRQSTSVLSLAAALGGAMVFATSTHAAVSITSNAPTADSDDIAQIGFSGDNTYGSNNYSTNDSSPPGQTFTAGTSANTLDSVSIQIDSNGSADFGVPGEPGENHSVVASDWPYTLSIDSVTGNTFANLQSQTGTIPVQNEDHTVANLQGGDWLTFTLDSPVALTPGLTYAYSLQTPDGDHAHYTAPGLSDGDQYAGGNAGNFDPDTNTFTLEGSNDASFVLGINGPVAVPEPASLALMGLGGLALLGRRRRRSLQA